MGIRVAVIGGSIGGLSSALALRCINCDVNVFERSSGEMKSRGAGLVVQNRTRQFLKRTWSHYRRCNKRSCLQKTIHIKRWKYHIRRTDSSVDDFVGQCV
jgi:2-polyprenyl-6-methoxyphenol hydroxylase-like FAD-dependent oxidoreductase